jgi:hypothetical protein
MLKFISDSWDWYISGFVSNPDKKLFESPRFWRVVITWTIISCSISSIQKYFQWVLLLTSVSAIALGIWLSISPSGKKFSKEFIDFVKATISAEKKLSSYAREIVQKSDFFQLMSERTGLMSYSSARAWKDRANEELQYLAYSCQAFYSIIAEESNILSDKKILLLRKKHWVKFEFTIEKLQAEIDITPASHQEKQEILKSFRELRKELVLDKREAALISRSIREKARVQSVRAGRALGMFYNPKLAEFQRRNIRHEREKDVAYHVNSKASIEGMILQIDRYIHWLEIFES